MKGNKEGENGDGNEQEKEKLLPSTEPEEVGKKEEKPEVVVIRRKSSSSSACCLNPKTDSFDSQISPLIGSTSSSYSKFNVKNSQNIKFNKMSGSNFQKPSASRTSSSASSFAGQQQPTVGQFGHSHHFPTNFGQSTRVSTPVTSTIITSSGVSSTTAGSGQPTQTGSQRRPVAKTRSNGSGSSLVIKNSRVQQTSVQRGIHSKESSLSPGSERDHTIINNGSNSSVINRKQSLLSGGGSLMNRLKAVGSRKDKQAQQLPQQPPPQQAWKPLSISEKRFLLAVERGDLASVRRFLETPPGQIPIVPACGLPGKPTEGDGKLSFGLKGERVDKEDSFELNENEEFNINCCDPIGRSALLMAIDNENLEMIELLISYEVEMKDALLHAINEEFVEAVELLLDHEESIHTPGTPFSWEAVERETFTCDVTPLILAAHKNNYEIIKLILDRGISPIPSPHDARCGCKTCRVARMEDHLRHSRSRINAYRALASPSLIALSSKDPILTAFELSWQLRRLSFLEPEFKTEYLELRKQCQSFATSLLDHTRTTHELEVLLNHDPSSTEELSSNGSNKMTLSRLKLAIRCKQKKFCAHANVQQLLASIWYEGLPGFRRKNIVVQTLQIIFIGFLFPFFSIAYIVAPFTSIGQVMKKPFIKFICHSASYMTFLVLLALASQRIETDIFNFDLTNQDEAASTKRGAPPTLIELMVLPWVLGLIWSEIKQLWELGLADYLSDMWNILDFITNSLYVATITLRVIAYLQVRKEIALNTGTANLPREKWDAFDPILLAEGLFAAANIFSSLKLVYIFSVNPHLGPLQISLGRMVIDILKFFSVYTLVCFAFACGMNQLLWYYADMEKSVCIRGSSGYSDLRHSGLNISENRISGPIIISGTNRTYMQKSPNEACLTYRKFSNLFESLQTLFWATFGLIDLENFELTGIQSYTRFWGMTMFGCYCIINVTVLLNLLIAMMNHSYQIISEQADTEWKFARTKLWMSYFEDGATVPIPFNIIPTPKSFFYFFRWIFKKFFSRTKFAKNEAIRTIRRKARQASERDHRYQNVMRSLVRRYITNEQRTAERQRGVTEDDCNEIKQDISALRFELIEILGNTLVQRPPMMINPNQFNPNQGPPFGGQFPGQALMAYPMAMVPGMMGMSMDSSGPNSGGLMNVMGKRGRKRERRLMKGFDFNFLFMDPSSAASFDAGESISTTKDAKDTDKDFDRKSIKSSCTTTGVAGAKSPLSKNRFARLARNLAGKKSASTTSSRTNKWFKLIEATKSKVNPFNKSTESLNSVGLAAANQQKREEEAEEENIILPKEGRSVSATDARNLGDAANLTNAIVPNESNEAEDDEISKSDLLSLSFEFKNSFDASVKRDLFAKRRSTTLFHEEDEANESSSSSSSTTPTSSSSSSSTSSDNDVKNNLNDISNNLIDDTKPVIKTCEIKEAPRLMVTLPLPSSKSLSPKLMSPSSKLSSSSTIDTLIHQRRSASRSPIMSPSTQILRRQSETTGDVKRSPRSPTKKSLSTNTTTSTSSKVSTSSKSNSRSPSKSPSNTPSPATLNASVLIGLTQVTRKRKEWI